MPEKTGKVKEGIHSGVFTLLNDEKKGGAIAPPFQLAINSILS